MIHGASVDLVEIDRIQALHSRQPKLVERILTGNEQHKFNNLTHGQHKIEFLIGRFVTKETLSEALGTGLGKHVAFNNVDRCNDELDRPKIDYKGFIVHVSISYTEHCTMSQVVLEKSAF